MQYLHTAGHPGLVHLRMEDRTARITQVVRIARMALDMAIGVGVVRDIAADRDAYPNAALYPSSSAKEEHLSNSGEELSSDIGSSV